MRFCILTVVFTARCHACAVLAMGLCLSGRSRCTTKTAKCGIIQRTPVDSTGSLRYDTIRDAILTCARKPTRVSLIYRAEPTTKKCKNRKTKSRKQIPVCSDITVNSLGNPCSESWRRKRKGCGGKDLQKRKVLSLEWKWVGDGIPSNSK